MRVAYDAAKPRLSLNWQAWLLLLGLMLLPSCALSKVKASVKKMNSQGVIVLQIVNLSTTSTNYAYAVRRSASSINMLSLQVIGAEGIAVFLARQDKPCDVVAFSDHNGNGAYDLGEPVQWLQNVHPKAMTETQSDAPPLQATLSPDRNLPADLSLAITNRISVQSESLPVAIGEIADLDAPRFSAEAGETGMWQPFEFIQRHVVGMYFLEPYTPKKTPVIFVYGIAGSAQNWRPILKRLDRRKYQPWIYQYASGVRLGNSADALASLLLFLKQRHGYDHVDIVAHSMGGLVARGAIQRLATTGTNFVSCFITISTPWAGQPAAELGVKHLEFPVPAWIDMSPSSAYLKETVAEPLPAGTRHYLIFSYKGSGGIGLPNENDGVVGLESQLVPKVQEVATSILGLHENHTEILSSPRTIKRVTEALDQ